MTLEEKIEVIKQNKDACIAALESVIDTLLNVTDPVWQVDKDGNLDLGLKDKKALAKSIADDWSDYVVTVGEQGAKPATPPANTGGQTMTKESIMAIKNRGERQKAIAENPELFGIE
jgi:hypothetical protein